MEVVDDDGAELVAGPDDSGHDHSLALLEGGVDGWADVKLIGQGDVGHDGGGLAILGQVEEELAGSGGQLLTKAVFHVGQVPAKFSANSLFHDLLHLFNILVYHGLARALILLMRLLLKFNDFNLARRERGRMFLI